MDVLISHNQFPTILSPTQPRSVSLLDNMLLSWPGYVDSFVVSVNLSDHLPEAILGVNVKYQGYLAYPLTSFV